MTCKYCDKDTDICVNADCPLLADFCPWDNHKEDCRYAETEAEMDIYEKAIAHYGEKNQIIVAIEELSELQKELCKHLRGEGNQAHISEEMADVGIMLDQLDLIFGNRNEVLEIRSIKLGRLVNRMRVIKCPTCGITMDEKPDVCPVCGGKM